MKLEKDKRKRERKKVGIGWVNLLKGSKPLL